MKDRTLIAVVSCAAYQHRRAAVRETWASLPRNPGVDLLFFVGIGSPIEAEPDLYILRCNDGYASLPLKTLAIVEYAYTRGYTRLIKVDDDTYLRLPEALEVLGQGDCVSHVRYNPPHSAFVDYPQGGCYSLSLRSMEAVLAEPEMFNTGKLEDGTVGQALHRHGIQLTHSDRIKTHYKLGQPFPENDIISAHKVDDAKIMKSIHVPLLLHKCTAKGDI